MAIEKMFFSCLIILILFNFLLFVIPGGNSDLLSVSSIIGIFTGAAVIVALASFVPTTEAGSGFRWVLNIVIALCLFYNVDFTIGGTSYNGTLLPGRPSNLTPIGLPTVTTGGTWNIKFGVGLATNITKIFSSDPNTLAFIPWLFFTFVGLMGAICAILMMAGGDD